MKINDICALEQYREERSNKEQKWNNVEKCEEVGTYIGGTTVYKYGR